MAAARNAVRRIGVLQGALVKRQTYRGRVESRRHQNTYDGRWPPDHGVGIDNVEAQVAQASLVNLQTNTLARQGYDMTQRGLMSQKVEVNGASIHYISSGIGDHALLLLPGALGCAVTDFSPQVEHLDKAKFTVIAWDPRGYGNSRPPDRDWPLTFLSRDADDAAGMMEKLGYSSYSLLGWSDGGNTAMIMAARYPERIRKLVMWGSNCFTTEKDMECIKAVRDLSKWSDRMKQPFIHVYGEEYFKAQWEAWYQAYSDYFYKNKGDICRDELKNITSPTLIVHGDKDPMLDPVHPVYLHENIQNSRLVRWPEGKHNIHLRYFEDFNKLVTDFLLEQ
ncbi:valacyclovir hydrolase isoform X2 [Lingula anatina]|uniref:Valacyclovir hydrolase isoform X2 n=1 Tax=Lingula anatina TaxID=7574 RepID=A0A1S3JM40_LINAN|nr:valacyclovir hydrolase isoform X2 [Lingula anatina]|eukprot:XP_013411453.1 valacyclovir hydrolase isoform X2 [Lingula anatina]